MLNKDLTHTYTVLSWVRMSYYNTFTFLRQMILKPYLLDNIIDFLLLESTFNINIQILNRAKENLSLMIWLGLRESIGFRIMKKDTVCAVNKSLERHKDESRLQYYGCEGCTAYTWVIRTM